MRLTAFSLCLALALPAAADPVTVTATLTYRERIALPSGTQVLAELRDGDGRLIGESRTTTDGAQVPLPVSVTAQGAAEVLVLRAAILGPGAPWVTDPVALPRSRRDAGDLVARRVQPAGPAIALRCGPDLFWLARGAEGARVRRGGLGVDLVPVPAASGVKAVAPGDPGTWAWSKGAEVTLSWRGAVQPPCAPDLDRLAAAFAARGTEPFWRLDIAGGTADFAPMDGPGLRLSLRPAEATATGLRYAAEGLAITLADRVAQDQMSGMSYPVTVTVETAEAVVTGTGGDPADLLEGLDWRVAEAGGTVLPEGLEARLRFEGRGLSGHGGCNSFSGSFELTGEALAFGPIAATMKACDGARMAAERAVFAALGATRGFDIAPDGALILTGDAGPVARLLP